MRSIFLASTAIVAAAAYSTSAQAQATDFDVAGQPLLFSGAGTGTGTGVGSSRAYANVITIGGQAIDARVTLTGLSGATLSDFDSTANPYAESNFFQPTLNISSVGGSATFRIEFLANGQPVTLRNFYVNTYDLDGSGGSAAGRQFTTFSGFASYQLSSTTSIQLQSAGGGTRFITTVGGNITASPGAAQFNDIRARAFYASASSFDITVGDNGATGVAYFGLDFSLGYAFGNAAADTTAPAVGAGQTLSYQENRSANTIIGKVTASDNIGVVNYRFAATNSQTSADGYYTIDNVGDVRITAAGVAAGIATNDFELAPNSHVYAIQAVDAANNWSAAQNVTFAELDLDDTAPTVTVPGNTAGAAITDVSINEGVLLATTLGANETVTWTLGGGVDQNLFTVDPATGALSFNAAPDFEAPADADADNVYEVLVTATDASGNATTTTVRVTVLDLEDVAPAVAPNQVFSYAEGRAANDAVGTVAASDNVAVTQFRFTATGTQTSADGYYAIDSGGVIRITAAGVAAGVANNDFEIAPNSFNYAVEAGDAAGNWSASSNVTLNVTDVDDAAPTVPAGQSFNYAENQAANAVIGTVTATDTVGVTAFRFAATGTQTSADGYYAIDNGGVLRITAAGSAAGVANNDFETAPNSFNHAIEAGDAAGNWSAPSIVALNVTDVNEVVNTPPAIGAGQILAYAENQSANGIIGTVAASDDVGVTAFRFAATGTQSSADGYYTIDNGGVVRITAAGVAAGLANNDFEIAPNSFIFAVEAGDASGSWSPATNVTFEVTNLADTPPVITGPGGATGGTATISVPEGTTAVTQVSSNVPGTTWAISGGNDQGRFSIDAGGNLLFNAAPDYEAPADSDTDNSYVLVVEATSPDGSTATQTITVNVTNLADTPPVITGPGGSTGGTATISVPEGTTAVTQVTSSVPGTTWAISGGNDQGQFSIDAGGNLVFNAAPDYEAPADSDTDNSYVLVVEATSPDGSTTTQTITVNVTNLADTPPVITGPGGSTGGTATISVPEGTEIVTTLTANRPVTWTIVGGSDGAGFSINAAGQVSFVAPPSFEDPTDSDRDNAYVLVVEAVDANGERSQQTITVIVLNVDELQAKLNEIGSNLRGDLRNRSFSSLSAMLAFNEGLLGLDNGCAGVGTKPFGGRLNANEKQQEAEVHFRRDLNNCEARTRVVVDGGVAFNRVAGQWSARGLATFRVERRVGNRTVLGAALLGTTSSDELASFSNSRVSDRSLQLNLYGRTHLSERLRLAAFAGWGRSWYDFKLNDDGLSLDGEMNGKRYLYGAALSGDINVRGLMVTTDAILSRAVEKLGSASLDASYAGESRSNMLFRLGKVDITRLSVPVHVPITFDRPIDGRDPTQLDISPGLLCQDTAQDSSALDCGYQLGFKFRVAPTVRSLLRAEARTEAVDGYLLNSFTIGFERRFGTADRISLGVDATREARSEQADNRITARLNIRP